MATQLDKSLDELINEKRPSRPRSTAHVPKKDDRAREERRGGDHKPRGRRSLDEAPAPRGAANYWQHDDRAEEPNGWQQSRGAPPPGQRWQRGQGPRSTAVAARDPDPIITTADGWEEVAQDQPRRSQQPRAASAGGGYYSDNPYSMRGGRGGGFGPQRRRGGVFDRLGLDEQYHQGQYDMNGRQQKEYDPAEEDARPRKPAYYDEHDHREDPRAGRGYRFEPYSRGFGRRGRGRGRFPGNKWKHDLFEETAAAAEEGEQQQQGEAADEAVDDAAAAAAAEMQE